MQKADAFGKRPKVAGIVTEYNPFHNGHEWMVEKLKSEGFGSVVCVMSGPFVQRAEPAILPTHIRAKAALAGGADLVIRLPAPWATASAEGFGAAGAGLLAALGCVDVVAFGAETPDTLMLDAVAATLLMPSFSAHLRKYLLQGLSFAAARAKATEEMLPGAGEILAKPNNILAVEYCKALRGGAWRDAANEEANQRYIDDNWGFDISENASELPQSVLPQSVLEEPQIRPFGARMPKPLALQRIGASHDGAPFDDGKQLFASAKWLREFVSSNLSGEKLRKYVPQSTFEIVKQAVENGDCVSYERWETVLMARLRGMKAEDMAKYPGASEGLATRLEKAAGQAVTSEEMFALAKTKRFAHSRVRRLALAAALNFEDNLPPVPPFLHVLAASEKGLQLLKIAKTTAALPFSTSLAKLAKTSKFAAKIEEMEARAEDIYALCEKVPKAGGNAHKQPFVKG